MMQKSGSLASRLTQEAKVELRRQLPALLESASTDANARAEAVKACVATQSPLPPSLLDPSLLAALLTERELLGAFGRLTTSTVTRDCSAVLAALRNRLEREFASGSAAPQKIVRSAMSALQKVLRLAVADAGSKRAKPGPPPTLVTVATVGAVGDLGAWTVKTALSARSRIPRDPRQVAGPWIAGVDALWQRAPSDADSRVLAQFWRDISAALGPSAVASLRADSRVATFLARKRDAISRAAAAAFQHARLDTLRSLEALHDGDRSEWNDVLEQLRAASASATSAIPEASLAWLSSQFAGPAPRRELTAADESQAATIDYATAALIAAWDARTEGPRAAEAYEAVLFMAQALFKLDIVGAPGEVVPFDETKHQLTSPGPASPPATARLLRPGIRWSDGIRSRTVIRATVEEV